MGAQTLQLLFFLLTAGLHFGLGFNDGWAAFLPKGDEPGDASGLISRKSLNTRPLGLKSTDNKLVAAVTCDAFEPVVDNHVHRAQRGFSRRRNFLHHAIEADAHGRATLTRRMLATYR